MINLVNPDLLPTLDIFNHAKPRVVHPKTNMGDWSFVMTDSKGSLLPWMKRKHGFVVIVFPK